PIFKKGIKIIMKIKASPAGRVSVMRAIITPSVIHNLIVFFCIANLKIKQNRSANQANIQSAPTW
ncbi:unnamed protein product, partial [marine sediment metagenome]